MCLDDQPYPKISERNQILMPSFLKTDGQAFSMEKAPRWNATSGEGMSNLILNRQKQCRINWPSEISGLNMEKDPKSLFLENCPLPLPSLASKVHLLWNASICCWKKTPNNRFSPSAKNLCFHEFSVRPYMSSLFLSVTKGGILSSVFVGTEHVFIPLYVSVSHF